MTLLNNFPHECEVYRTRFERKAGQIGNVEIQYLHLGGDDTPLVCWVQNASSTEILEFQKRDCNITHRVSFRTEADVDLSDKVLVTKGPFLGKYFTVRTRPVERTAGYGLAWTAFCEIDR